MIAVLSESASWLGSELRSGKELGGAGRMGF